MMGVVAVAVVVVVLHGLLLSGTHRVGARWSSSRGDGAGGEDATSVCIVGAGPAGLQLGYRLQRMNISYVIFERNAQAGSFFKHYPRHRMLVSLNKLATGSTDYEFNLRHDWNSLVTDVDDPRGQLLFRNYSSEFYPHADHMVEYLNGFQRMYDINVRFNTTVTRIARSRSRRSGGTNRDPFTIHLRRGSDGSTYTQHCLPLIIATGTPIPSYPRVAPGIENTEGYEKFDPATAHTKYRGKRVLILGAGNSAFEVANNISGVTNFVEMCSRNPPKFSWQTHYAGDVRSINAAFLDTYQLKAQNFISTCIVSAQTAFGRHRDGAVEADTTFYSGGAVEDAQEAMHVLFPGRSDQRTYTARAATYDHVIRCLGFQMDPSIFDASTAPQLDNRRKYPLLTPEWESINVEDLFFAGTLMAGRDNKRSAVFAVHGFRYAVESLGNVLAARYFHTPWPTRTVANAPADLASAIIERVQYSSGLYQMYLSMCEVLWFERDCSNATLHASSADGAGGDAENHDDGRSKGCWRHQSHVPCDMVFTDKTFLHRSFVVVTLEYHPDFGKTREKFDVFGADHIDPALHPDEGHRSNFLHPVVRYYSGLRHDGSEHVHFTHVNPEARSTADDVTEWQSNRLPSQAVAMHHIMESVFIDFAHLEAHIEPLVRFLAGLLATRPELLPAPHASPIFKVRVQSGSKPARASLHPQAWMQRNLNMEPEDLIDVMHDIEDTVRQRAGAQDRYKDSSAWESMAMLRGTKGVHFADDQGQQESLGLGGSPGAGGAGGAEGAGGGALTQEQMRVFMDTLNEALEKPVAEMPELRDVEGTVANAREATERLSRRLEEQKRSANGVRDNIGDGYEDKAGVEVEEEEEEEEEEREKVVDGVDDDDNDDDDDDEGFRNTHTYDGRGPRRPCDHNVGDDGDGEWGYTKGQEQEGDGDEWFDGADAEGGEQGEGEPKVGTVEEMREAMLQQQQKQAQQRRAMQQDLARNEELSEEDKEELAEVLADADNVLSSLDRITDMFSGLGRMAEGDEYDENEETWDGGNGSGFSADADGDSRGGGGGENGEDEDGGWMGGKRVKVRPSRKKSTAGRGARRRRSRTRSKSRNRRSRSSSKSKRQGTNSK